jgi:hypothetical protein
MCMCICMCMCMCMWYACGAHAVHMRRHHEDEQVVGRERDVEVERHIVQNSHLAAACPPQRATAARREKSPHGGRPHGGLAQPDLGGISRAEPELLGEEKGERRRTEAGPRRRRRG